MKTLIALFAFACACVQLQGQSNPQPQLFVGLYDAAECAALASLVGEPCIQGITFIAINIPPQYDTVRIDYSYQNSASAVVYQTAFASRNQFGSVFINVVVSGFSHVTAKASFVINGPVFGSVGST